jgi:hypothetical protein
MESDPRQELLLGLLHEIGAGMRLRTEPEHLYTAASIAGFGAVSWGIAALPIKIEETGRLPYWELSSQFP